MGLSITVVSGDLFEQDVDAIVNAWNVNLIPWWLLVPKGVSGELRKRAGSQPFRELVRAGFLRPGSAVVTGAGQLPFRGVIHVAGLNCLWRSSEHIIRACVRNALALAAGHGYSSVAFPLIGAGVGGLAPRRVEEILIETASTTSYNGRVVVVRYRPG